MKNFRLWKRVKVNASQRSNLIVLLILHGYIGLARLKADQYH
jgi:hypothetical protein